MRMLAIDLAKQSFHVHGISAGGQEDYARA